MVYCRTTLKEMPIFIVSGEADLGSAGEQLNRNILIDWNGHGGVYSPPHFILSFWSYLPNKTQSLNIPRHPESIGTTRLTIEPFF